MGTEAASLQSVAGSLPVVWVLSTGGTIAGKGASSMSLTEYQAARLGGAELLASVPEIGRYAQVRVEQVLNVPSPDMTPEVWRTLADNMLPIPRSMLSKPSCGWRDNAHGFLSSSVDIKRSAGAQDALKLTPSVWIFTIQMAIRRLISLP